MKIHIDFVRIKTISDIGLAILSAISIQIPSANARFYSIVRVFCERDGRGGEAVPSREAAQV
jgi:hypothetical protein